MRLIDTLLINRIPCTGDPTCDVKKHVLEFSTLVMNSQHSVYTLASLYREMPVRISAPKIFLFVVVIIVVDDNVVVVFLVC